MYWHYCVGSNNHAAPYAPLHSFGEDARERMQCRLGSNRMYLYYRPCLCVTQNVSLDESECRYVDPHATKLDWAIIYIS